MECHSEKVPNTVPDRSELHVLKYHTCVCGRPDSVNCKNVTGDNSHSHSKKTLRHFLSVSRFACIRFMSSQQLLDCYSRTMFYC